MINNLLNNNIIISIIIIILIIVIVIVIYSRYVENKLLVGFWTAKNNFCKESGLESFIVKINDDLSGYILMVNSDGILINNPVQFDLSGVSVYPGINEYREYNCVIDWLGEDEYDYFPSKQLLTYYPLYGQITFSANDEINAVLFKNNLV